MAAKIATPGKREWTKERDGKSALGGRAQLIASLITGRAFNYANATFDSPGKRVLRPA